MDYEKKYKEALGWMQSLYNGLHGTTKEDAEHYFPELKESDDEKMRKQLLNWFKDCNWDSIDNGTLKRGDIVAWLEKQGEPQPYRGNADTMRKNLIKAFKSVGGNHWGGFDVRDIIHFLESKDAIELEKQGEQKPMWSKEDITNHSKVLFCLQTLTFPTDDERKELITWLKKECEPQPHWKPTEEQLMALRDAIDNNEMESLYNELKKL